MGNKVEHDYAALVNVNSHHIRDNAKALKKGALEEELAPVFSCRKTPAGKPTYADAVIILDKDGNEVGRLVYEPNGGLACGARAYLVLKHAPSLEGRLQECEEACAQAK